jgi:hypothetical protein
LTTPNNPKDITMNIPAWMDINTVGFNFIDPDGDFCMLLGSATFYDNYSEEYIPNALVYACRYKNCWHLGNILDQDQAWLDNCRQVSWEVRKLKSVD